MIETKDKILDSAERLFADRGYGATSLRHIIADAGVNLAAIHYHFGSKEGLLDHVIARNAEPVNQARISRLDQLEAEAGGAAVQLEKILDAFLAPAAAIATRKPDFFKLMGRIHAEGMMTPLARKHFMPTFTRFNAALRRAVPEMPEEEFIWKLHFLLGSMVFVMIARPSFAEGYEVPWDVKIAKLVAFACGGFRAPVPTVEEAEVTR